MRVSVRGVRGSIVPLLVLLLHGVILSQFSSGSTVAASRLHVREVELQRSLARYRQLLEQNDSGNDEAKRLDGEISSEQKEQDTKADGAVENPGKTPDDHGEVKQTEKQNSEESQEQRGDQNAKGDVSEKAEDQQPQGEVKDDQKAEEVKDDQKADEVKDDQKAVEVKDDQNADEVKDDQKAEEVKAEEKSQEEGPKVENVEESNEQGEPSPQSKEHQLEGGEQKIDQESESDSENQVHQEEERQETEVKTDEPHPEETQDIESKNEENKSEESHVSDTKSEGEIKQESEGQPESNTEEEKPAEEEPFVFPEPHLLGPTIKDWDEQRASWLDANPHMKSTPDGKPRVLIVTGSQPEPCRSPAGDQFHVKSLKLKIDYARMHNYEIYYNFAWLDPLFGSYWVKLPIVRKLMLTHPEIEWFFWVDSDAIFTDMLFEAPFDTYEGINMVMWGYHEGFYVQKSWVAFNAGVFIIRNCQWSLDLIDKWSPMGPDGPVRVEYGKILSSYLSNRPPDYAADDQSALAYLILTDEAVNSKVKLVELNEYMVSAWWVEVVDNYETSMEKYHPGLGDKRWPWITHFTGCGPCGGDGVSPDYVKCFTNIERALNFADNQVLAYMGFQHENLSSENLLRVRNESAQPMELLGKNPWEERIAQLAAATA